MSTIEVNNKQNKNDNITICDDNNVNDSVQMYLNNISKYHLLTAEDEAEIAKDIISDNPENKKKAIEKLVNSNLRLVVSLAKKYVKSGVSFLDLIQDGNIGLMRAAEKYDYRKGTKFSTYAALWINQSLKKALMEKSRLIRIPSNKLEMLSKIKKASVELVNENNAIPTTEEIAYRLNIPVEKIDHLLEMEQGPLCIDEPLLNKDKSLKLEDIIVDENSVSPEEEVYKNFIDNDLKFLLDKLSPKERDVITLRYGLGVEKMTLMEIADTFKLSKERIRQIETKALSKLIRYCNDENIDPQIRENLKSYLL